jgi:hypothetical protein
MLTKSPRYEIHIEGHLDERWALWFENMAIHRTCDTNGAPITSLTGRIDQSALCGILAHLCDLGVHLIRVERQPDSENDRSESLSDT